MIEQNTRTTPDQQPELIYELAAKTIGLHCEENDKWYKRFDAMLDCGAYLDAVMLMVPEGWFIGSLEYWPVKDAAGVTLLEAGNIGDWYGHDAEHHKRVRCRASTPALALASAIAAAKGV